MMSGQPVFAGTYLQCVIALHAPGVTSEQLEAIDLDHFKISSLNWVFGEGYL